MTTPQSVCPIRGVGGSLRPFLSLGCCTCCRCPCSSACLPVHLYFVYFYVRVLRGESAVSQGCEHIQLLNRFKKLGGLGSFGPGVALG